MIKTRLNAIPLVLQIPIGAEIDFLGVVDLIAMKALVWPGETKKGEDYLIEEIPADLATKAAEARHAATQTPRLPERQRPVALSGSRRTTRPAPLTAAPVSGPLCGPDSFSPPVAP